MTKYRNEIFNDTCWVYVQHGDSDTYIIGITYSEDFRQQEISADRPMLLWRRFEDTLSAAGYRMVLKNLSIEALQKILEA